MLILDPSVVGPSLVYRESAYQIAIAPMSFIYMIVILVERNEKCGTWDQTGILPHVLHYRSLGLNSVPKPGMNPGRFDLGRFGLIFGVSRFGLIS